MIYVWSGVIAFGSRINEGNGIKNNCEGSFSKDFTEEQIWNIISIAQCLK